LSTELHSTEQMLLPSLSYFDHMIACVDLPRARRCTDLTVPGLHVDEVPMGLHGAIAFVLQPRRAGVFSWQSKGAFAIDVDTRVHLACDGAAQDETTRRFSGPAAAFVRSSLASQTKAARTKEITERYKSVVGRGEPFDVGVTGLDEYDRDVSIKTSARWRPSDSPLQAGEIADADPWLLDYAVSFRATNVQHPFRHEGLSLVSRRRYELCSTLGGKLFGAELDLRSEFGQLTRSYKADGPNVVTVETRVDLPPGEVPTERLDAYRAFLTGALAQTDVWFSVVPHGR
jgi:hypothetical protein